MTNGRSAHCGADRQHAEDFAQAQAAAGGQQYPPGCLYIVATPIGNLVLQRHTHGLGSLVLGRRLHLVGQPATQGPAGGGHCDRRTDRDLLGQRIELARDDLRIERLVRARSEDGGEVMRLQFAQCGRLKASAL